MIKTWFRKLSYLWREPERAKAGISQRAKQAKKSLIMKLPSVVHAGNRANCREVVIDGSQYFKKTFSDDDVSQACLIREIEAREIFADRDWLTPIIHREGSSLILPLYPVEFRLDNAVARLSDKEKRKVAEKCVKVAFDIFSEGYAHRDFHAKNMFLVDGALLLVDFEMLKPYPLDHSIPFLQSYDLRANGLDSPNETMSMCYESSDPYSLLNVLGVHVDEVIPSIEMMLKENLNAASLTFKKRGTRHVCQAQMTYNSIDLPYLKVDPSEAQRNCTKRVELLGLSEEQLSGKRLLDLGSNIGGMIFEAQKFHPEASMGVEYDAEKVGAARMVAAYNGLGKVSFLEADIDNLEKEDVGGTYDVVFCFAIEAHVQKKQRLYELLAELTDGVLYFEGNASTDLDSAKSSLIEAGFQEVEYLGMCNDDYLQSNNNRPVWRARKG